MEHPETYLYKSIPHIQCLLHAERGGDCLPPGDDSPAGKAVHHILRVNLAKTPPNTAAYKVSLQQPGLLAPMCMAREDQCRTLWLEVAFLSPTGQIT